MKLQFLNPENNTVDFEFTGKTIKDLYNNILEKQGEDGELITSFHVNYCPMCNRKF